MSTDRQQPRVRSAQHAPQHRQAGDGLDAFYAVGMMRNPHRPGKDDALRLGISVSDGFDLFSPDARLVVDLLPLERLEPVPELGPPFAMLLQEGNVMSAHFDDPLGDPGEQRQIAADVRLHVEAGDRRAEQHAPHVAGDAEVDQAGLDNRIDHDALAASPSQVFQ